MKKLYAVLFVFLLFASTILFAIPVKAAETTTVDYGDYTLTTPYSATHWDGVWDLTQGDLVLSYTIDMSGITQPHGLPSNPTEWEAYVGPTAKDPSNYPDSYTPWVEVGLRGPDAGDFNPGPFGVYQGKCGGWMVSESDDWVGYWDNGVFIGDGTATQDLDDKHSLQASGGRSELDYDVLLSTPDNVDSIPSPYWWYPSPMGAYGSWNNHGLWFDRDGVDQYQALSWGNSGENAGRINTAGIYHIEITYHAIDVDGDGVFTDDCLGVMFAKVNGVQQGFYTSWVSGAPQYYPVGLSFKADVTQLQVFAGIYAGDPAGWDYGSVQLSSISVTGHLGTLNPLTPDFSYTFNSNVLSTGETVQFTDQTSGGMPPYTYLWNFGDGTTSTEQNPTHIYNNPGTYKAELTVNPFRCTPKTFSKDITVYETGYINVIKYYDANANGLKDTDEPLIPGWKVNIGGTVYETPALIELPLGDYTVTEVMPIEDNWKNTTPSSVDVTVDTEFEPMYATSFTVGKIVPVNFDPYNPTNQIDRLNPSNALGPFDAVAPAGVSDFFFATGARTSSHYTFADKFMNVAGAPDIEFAEVTWGTGGSWHTEAMKVYLTGAAIRDSGGNIVDYGATDDGIGYYAGIAWNRIGLEYIDDATRLAVTESYFLGSRNFADNVFYRSGDYGTYTQFHLPDEVVYAEGVYLVDITTDVYDMAYPATYLNVGGTGALVTLNSAAWDVINYDQITAADVTADYGINGNTDGFDLDAIRVYRADVEFGNLCFGPGGGHTPGFWSNKNGQATINDEPDGMAPEFAMLSELNLVDKKGDPFVPSSYSEFKGWLLKSDAVNMAYKLSVSLAAMALNVEAGFVNPEALVYAPNVVDGADYITIEQLMEAANVALGEDGYTPAGDPNRINQEYMYSALDNANNNMNFVQAEPCTFTYPL